MTISVLFDHVFQRRMKESKAFDDLPRDTPCGYSCEQAITEGKRFMDASDPSIREEIIGLVEHTCEIFFFG